MRVAAWFPSSSSPSPSPTPRSSASMYAQLTVPLSVGGITVGGFKGDSTLYAAVQKFILDTFKQFPVCSHMFLRTKFTKTLSSNNSESGTKPPPAWASDSSMIDEAFRAALSTLAQKMGSVYAIKATGDPEVDKFRAVIMSEFNQRPSIKKAEVMEKCKKEIGEDCPQGIYNKITKELAYSRGISWILKSGEN